MDKRKLALILSHSAVNNSEDSDSSLWSDVYSSASDNDNYCKDDTLILPITLYLIGIKNKRDVFIQLIDSWSDTEFENHLKIPKYTADRLIGDLEKSGYLPNHKCGVKPLEPKLCFYIFIFFITSTDPLIQIASKFDISISSTFRVIRRIISWLLTKLNDVIRWPTHQNDIKNINNLFSSKTGISNVLGIIDCLHIKIEKAKNPRQYCNAKGYFSIILQATIDANSMFTNIYCGEPGSSNCIRVLKKSPLYSTAIKDKNLLFPWNTYLLGHSGYPSLAWLVPSYRDNRRLTLAQKEFNCAHTGARKICEKTFISLKSRFKRIRALNAYKNIVFVTNTIVAACILHNYCANRKRDDK